jgi:N-acetylmuramoyl-L-alanine amidase CwlA
MDGAHCPGANRTNIGVAVAGNYAKSQPPELALSTLVMLLADLCVTHGIATKDIIPHSDRRPTECPGDQMRAKLVSIRERVESLLPIAGAI